MQVYFAGPNACIGRTLALQELRLALTGLVHRFDFQFTPNFVQDDWLGSLKDHFVLTRGVLPVIVRCR
jgi:cytochrome P450